jgi:hypothetical protein
MATKKYSRKGAPPPIGVMYAMSFQILGDEYDEIVLAGKPEGSWTRLASAMPDRQADGPPLPAEVLHRGEPPATSGSRGTDGRRCRIAAGHFRTLHAQYPGTHK